MCSWTVSKPKRLEWKIKTTIIISHTWKWQESQKREEAQRREKKKKLQPKQKKSERARARERERERESNKSNKNNPTQHYPCIHFCTENMCHRPWTHTCKRKKNSLTDQMNKMYFGAYSYHGQMYTEGDNLKYVVSTSAHILMYMREYNRHNNETFGGDELCRRQYVAFPWIAFMWLIKVYVEHFPIYKNYYSLPFFSRPLFFHLFTHRATLSHCLFFFTSILLTGFNGTVHTWPLLP